MKTVRSIVKSTGTGFIFACIIIGLIFIVNITSKESNYAPEVKIDTNAHMAYNKMQDYVKKQLKSPTSAKFPSFYDTASDNQATDIGGQKHRVISYVDAQNSLGVVVRTRFIGEVAFSVNLFEVVSLNME